EFQNQIKNPNQKGRRKMFRLHKSKDSPKSGERIDFKVSSFKALQVPKGWDKLYVSIVSAETGKTIGKLGKAAVRNGCCQWTETLSQSIWISPNDDDHDHPQSSSSSSSKDIEDCLFKYGSARSGIVGEATLNMASYMTSNASDPVSLPLNKCNHGTVLQANSFPLFT
ncbi:hypothetical protein Tsubulata_034408, partial [Turnera subulata]